MKCALYRFYDACGALLYVGMSRDPFARFGQHKAVRGAAMEDVSRMDVQWFSSRDKANRAERKAVPAEKPLWNIALKGPRREGAGLKPKRSASRHVPRRADDKVGPTSHQLTLSKLSYEIKSAEAALNAISCPMRYHKELVRQGFPSGAALECLGQRFEGWRT